MPATWQLCSGDAHQQRYLPDRQAVLRYMPAIGPKAASERFEVWAEWGPVTPADDQPGGRTFALAEALDLSRPRKHKGFGPSSSGSLTRERKVCARGLSSRPEPHTSESGDGPFPRRTP